MTDPQTRWIDPNPPDSTNPRTTAILAAAGVLLTVLVVATLVVVVLNSTGSGDDKPIDEALLIAANTPTTEPFTRSIVVAPVTISEQVKSDTAALLQQVPVRANRGVRPVSGRQPHLYGATGEEYPCDVVTLANDLDVAPATARTWGLALGLTPQQIPYYLNTLTPVVLLADTWVTTHALDDGAAKAKQAVLQAGNAILVDPLGVPRTHCATGAPLTPPADDALTNYKTSGDKWPGFGPPSTVAIQYSSTDHPEPDGDFTLVDIDSGQPIPRKSGGIIALGDAALPLPDPAVMNVPPTTSVHTQPRPGER